MALVNSPRIVTDNLELYFDAGNLKSYDPNAGIFGQQVFTTTGTSSWTVPTGVTEVSAVVVGGGGGGGGAGGSGDGNGGGGGGGGGLAYGTFSVTAGESLTIVVGTAGAGGDGAGSGGSNGSNGGSSQIKRSTTVLLQGSGGLGGLYDMAAQTDGVGRGGGSSTGTERDGGGSGGGGEGPWTDTGGGGGGAAGYSGNGGAGKYGGYTDNSGFDGSGGGGGGGGAGQSTGRPGASGGGVGLLGEGTSGSGGAAGATTTGGGGGSGGTDGNIGNITTHNAGSAGTYGGGGGGAGTDGSTDGDGGDGGQGAVRIIWGAGRSYPSTSTADMLTSPDITNIGPKGARNISSLVGVAHTTDNRGVLVFDGTDGYVDTTSGWTNFGTDPFTIEVWYKTSSASQYETLVGNASGGAGTFQLDYNGSNNLRFQASTNSGEYVDSSISLSVGVWKQVVIVREGTGTNQFKIYSNGDLNTTGTFNVDLNSSAQLRIGRNRGGVYYYDGEISNVKAYKGKALTATEVAQNFNALRGRYGI